MKKLNFVIAIDGASASGKGTLAKLLANYFDCNYLSTGNIYRLLAQKALQQNIAIENTYLLSELARYLPLAELHNHTLADEKIASIASQIAVKQAIREILKKIQKNWVAKQKIAIIEGRDIGTVICPNADIKIFITASLEVRAKRRYIELQSKSNNVTYEEIYNELRTRDQRDSSRIASPLRKVDDAFLLDNTDMSINEVFKKALSLIENKLTI